MNLDMLRTEWAARDEKLESALRLNTRRLRESFLETNRAEIGRLIPFGGFEIAVWVGTLAALGLFMANHVGEMRFFVPALLIHVWTLVTGVVGLRQRTAMRALDYSQPTLATQRQLEALRIDRIRTFKWAFLTGQIVWWVPLTIVLFQGLLGVDLYASEFLRKFMAINVAAGVLFIPFAIWASKRIAGRFGNSGALARLADAIAGRDISAARDFLEKLARFEKE